MREIKFRGKCLEHEKKCGWVEGYLIISGNNYSILGEWEKGKGHLKHLVDKKTVGQFTGVHDIKGKEICEHDFVRGTEGEDQLSPKVEVVYDDGAFVLQKPNEIDLQRWVVSQFDLEVVGNSLENNN